MFSVTQVPDNCTEFETPISGLGFERNHLLHRTTPDSSLETHVYSNPGSVVGHFITHSSTFSYWTFGVHVGQLDRLTFYSPKRKRIVGYFIDCRKGSSTWKRRLALGFAPSVRRKLIIPCGVAHTFKGVDGVVTRNDLALFSGPSSSDSWNVVDDNIVFPWNRRGVERAPEVDANSWEIPLNVSTLFYQMQQEILAKGLKVALTSRKSTTRKNTAATPAVEGAVSLPRLRWRFEGCAFGTNRFDSIALKSWMIIPTTASCVMDFAILKLVQKPRYYRFESNQNVLHTFLDHEGSLVRVELVDLRKDSLTYKRSASVAFKCDPRFHLKIPAGIAYRYAGHGRYAVRVEREVFSDQKKVSQLLPATAQVSTLTDSQIQSFDGIRPSNRLISTAKHQEISARGFELMRACEVELSCDLSARSRRKYSI